MSHICKICYSVRSLVQPHPNNINMKHPWETGKTLFFTGALLYLEAVNHLELTDRFIYGFRMGFMIATEVYNYERRFYRWLDLSFALRGK